MARRRKDETGAGRWSVGVGEYGGRVRVCEEKRPGDKVVLRFRDRMSGGYTTETLGFSVRDAKGRVDAELAERATDAAKDRAAELRLDRMKLDAAPQALTVADGWARYLHATRGGAPKAPASRRKYERTRRLWTNWLVASTPWNRITPADVKALAEKLKEQGKVAAGVEAVKCLAAVHNWLVNDAGIDGLKKPTRGFKMKEYTRGYQPRRGRHTPEELEKIEAVRRQVDPRFALMFALMYDSVSRVGEVGELMRSHVDMPMPVEPTEAQAPHGWVFYPGVKGQEAGLDFLTRYQREALDEAFAGYLRELEAAYQAGTLKDYPIFPGHKLRQGIIPLGRPSANRPIAHLRRREWFRQAEALAGVEQREWRVWHGVRRGGSDYVYEETDLATLTAAARWSSEATPEGIYLDKRRYKALARAREALEKRGSGARKTPPESGAI